MTKKLRVAVGLVLLALVGGIGSYVLVTRSSSTGGENNRPYEVRYVWDNGIKSLQIINLKTGVEETDPRLRDLVSREAKSYLPGLVSHEDFARARGRFFLSLLGYEEPYLPRIMEWSGDLDLIRDPDITPLMAALDRGDAAKARELIAAGANVNAADQHGWTALMRAAAGGDTATVRALLAAGADANARNKEGETALFGAAFLGRLLAASELVRHGADVNSTSKLGATPLMEAIQACAPPVDFQSRRGSTAPVVGRASLSEFLIARGADVNQRGMGETPLHLAARNGCADVVQILIKAGADVNATDDEGRTALAIADASSHTQVERLLKQAGAHR
jgi:ankyrin repeat protein